MKKIDTKEYISVLREMVEEGHSVQVGISGSSMVPFLVHQRDRIYFEKPRRKLRTGDMVFYQRKNGQFVMHRIWKVKSDGYYIVGDGQTQVEGPVRPEQIFGLITRVNRKGKWITKGDFWWNFFAYIWIRVIPARKWMLSAYGFMKNRRIF